MAIGQNDKRGLQRPGTAESDFNELQYSIEQYLNNEVETAWIGRVLQYRRKRPDGDRGCYSYDCTERRRRPGVAYGERASFTAYQAPGGQGGDHNQSGGGRSRGMCEL